MYFTNLKKNQRAFNLIELFVVIIVFGILAKASIEGLHYFLLKSKASHVVKSVEATKKEVQNQFATKANTDNFMIADINNPNEYVISITTSNTGVITVTANKDKFAQEDLVLTFTPDFSSDSDILTWICKFTTNLDTTVPGCDKEVTPEP